jgi:hypothetical protein
MTIPDITRRDRQRVKSVKRKNEFSSRGAKPGARTPLRLFAARRTERYLLELPEPVRSVPLIIEVIERTKEEVWYEKEACL